MNEHVIAGAALADTDEDLVDPVATLDGVDLLEEPIWLLDLEIAGHVFRFSTETVEIERADGTTVLYVEGLGEPGTSYGSVAGVGDASVALDIDADEDWSELVANGHVLDGCRGALWRWRRGTVLERARLVLRGLTASPTYGARHEPLTLALAREPRDLADTLPPAQAVVDAVTWPRAGGHPTPLSALGLAYPVVIGLPGWDDSTSGVVREVVPVPLAEYGDGEGVLPWLGGDATSVGIRMVQGETITTATAAVVETEDLLERKVAAIDGITLPSMGADSAAFFIGFDPSTGGGIRFEGELVRGAGDVIAWVLGELYRGPVDHGRLNTARPYLNRYKIDTWINASVNAWDWLTSEVLPLLPVEMREGRDGVYPALLRWDLTREDVVRHLRGLDREGPIALDSSAIANEITVEYQPWAESGAKWIGRRVLSSLTDGRPGRRLWDVIGTDARILGDARCTESQRRYGLRPLTVQAGVVWDTPTAVRIALDRAARQALPRRLVRYVGDHDLEDLEIGQAVTVTDDEVHLDTALALVLDVVPVAGGTALDLVLLDTTRPA